MNEVFVKIKDTIFEEEFKFKDLVSVDEVLDKLEELMYENEELQNKIEDLNKEIEEKYELKKVDMYDFYGINEKDFA